MSRYSLLLFFSLASLRAGDPSLELTVEPRAGPLDQRFTITIVNRGSEPFAYDDCCSFPAITALLGGQDLPVCIECDPCPPEPRRGGILAPGESLEHNWCPEDATCVEDWSPAPGIYEVQWTGFPANVAGRFELLPKEGRTLELEAEPAEGRFGEPVSLELRNTSSTTLSYFCPTALVALDPRGIAAFCPVCPLCGPAPCEVQLNPGEVRVEEWTPGAQTCESEILPGRYRIIWRAFSGSREEYFGRTTVLVLPERERRLTLSLSRSEVRSGDLLKITATNPLDVPLWYDGCCDAVIFVDELGRESPCAPCTGGCLGGRGLEIPPGGSVSTEVRVPGSPGCGLEPGPWSVIWGRNFGLVPGDEPTVPVFGYAEVMVLPLLEGSFLRGDCNDDRGVDISDMIYLLAHLFLGGPGCCPDAADVNDDSSIDLGDPVFGLEYLFRGGPEPPAPGPRMAGFDGTPTDPFTCGDPPPVELPGVSFDLSMVPDAFTLDEAAAGVTFRYAVVIEGDLHGVTSLPLDAGGCDRPGPSGLRLFERISGDGQTYCLCDVGLCPPRTEPGDLTAGRYEEQLEWSGRNWFGPSDTLNPMGPPFPPGRYVLEVRARGTYGAQDGTELLFESTAATEFELLP